jgi:glycine cleavage system H protein
MPKKWKAVKVRQELVEEVMKEVDKSQYKGLSEFVSEAVRLRMQTLAKERVSEYLERDRKSRIPQLQVQALYTPRHIWAQATPQRTVKIGITDYFQEQLKQVVNVRTDKTGEKVSKGETFGVVESWWFTYDLISPINGRIFSVNTKIIEDPFTLNADPYQWIVEIQPEYTEVHSWTSGLLSLGEYKELVAKLEGQPQQEDTFNNVRTLGKVHTPEWKTIRLRQELVAAAKSTLETGRHNSLSEFLSEALRLHLEELKPSKEKVTERQAEYPMIQERLLYTRNHMWAMVTPEGNIRVGLSDFAQKRLKGIAGIQTHKVGYEVKKEEPLGVVETWMFMFDLYSPVSGKILKINKLLQDEPFIVSKDPYETGWIAEIKPNNLVTLEEELKDLIRLPQYKMWVSKLGPPRVLGI